MKTTSAAAARVFRSAASTALLLLWIAAAGLARAAAPEFDFHPPSSPADPAAGAAVRDLAERLLPVYQDPDPERYLANLSALQLVAGSYSAADVSRQSLRDRRRRADERRPAGRGVIYDVYAYAKAIEAEDRLPFAQAFAQAYREVFARLDNQDAYAVARWLALPPIERREALQKVLDQLRTKDRIGEAEAIQLVWAYLAYDAYREFGPLIPALDEEDDRRRYVVATVTAIKGSRGGARIAALVVRPKAFSKPLPALLEVRLDRSGNTAMESAARGYVGVAAVLAAPPNAARKRFPYRSDGDDARAVIDWIAAQDWSDGRVGMYGDGYGGFAAWAAAKRAPPALKAIATSAPTAPGIDFPMGGGIFRNSAFRWSLGATSLDQTVQAAVKDDAVWRALDRKWYASGRRYRDLGRIEGTPNPLFIRWLNHPSYDRYWQKMIPYRKQFAGIDIPVLTTTGYFAAGEPAALYYFHEHLRHNPHADHTLIIGPYDDAALSRDGPAESRAMPVDAAAQIDLHDLRYLWFDHVLKGAAAPPIVKDRVNYEVMGANQWRHAQSVEAMGAASVRFYLAADARGGGHALTAVKPARSRFFRQTVSLLDRGDADWTPPAELVSRAPALRNGTMFESDPLRKGGEFTGTFSASLDFRVNKLDMDVEIRLYEHTPAGDYVQLFSPADAFRASYVRDRAHRHLLKAGERNHMVFASERVTSRTLQAGSRLVMVLAIGKRPDREINYGTGGDVSEESVADGKIPLRIRWYNDSYIDLPMSR